VKTEKYLNSKQFVIIAEYDERYNKFTSNDIFNLPENSNAVDLVNQHQLKSLHFEVTGKARFTTFKIVSGDFINAMVESAKFTDELNKQLN